MHTIHRLFHKGAEENYLSKFVFFQNILEKMMNFSTKNYIL